MTQFHKTATEAVAAVMSNQRVFVHGGMATPNRLLDGLIERADELRHVEMMHIHTVGRMRYAEPEYAKSFNVASLFCGGNIRHHLDYDRVDFIPAFLSEIPHLFRSGRRKPDVALIHVSSPDIHGYCTLGTSVDVALAAVETADVIIAQINPQMPRVHGDGFLHISKIHHAIHIDELLPEEPLFKQDDDTRAIGRFAAGIIEDGATLQMGIGAVPDAVLAALKNHRHLGIHTEMWSDGCLDLIESGAVDNSQKKIHPGKVVSGFVLGSKRVYDFINDNPLVVQLDIAYVNDPAVIRRNPKVTAINSAVEIDLTGQICADSVGCRIISGIGGQMDFMRGAAISPGGKPIMALTSRSKKGEGKIVSTLKPGAGVVTTRGHAHYVITEYGVADLYGMTLHERANALISIAHPDDRERLDQEWHATRKKSWS